MKVIYEIGCNDGLHIKYPIISSYSACSFWAKIMVLVFILDDFEMIHMIGSCPLITTQWLVSMSGFYCPNYSTNLKNWENQLHRHQRDLCHPSKLVRWRELWASFGHSLANPCSGFLFNCRASQSKFIGIWGKHYFSPWPESYLGQGGATSTIIPMDEAEGAGGVEIGTTALMERQPGYFSSCVVVPTIFSHFSCSLLQLKPILLQIPHLQLTVFNLYPNICQKWNWNWG